MANPRVSKLRIGIIGLGVGEKHILAFNSHPACEIAALCDFSDKRLAMIKKCCPKARFTKKADEILNDPGIDLVSIASYDNYHFDQIIRALCNGKHVFTEKPLCLYRKEAATIKNFLRENPHVKLSSNLNLRTCPMFIQMKKRRYSGEMGDIFYLEGDYLWGRFYKLTNGWRRDMDFYSIVLGAAVHIIDILIWIMGKKPVEVKGYGNGIALSKSGFKYNDFAAILMKFEDGAVAKVSAQGGCVHPHFHRVSVYGTKKTFIHDELGGKLLEYANAKSKIRKITDNYPAVKEKGKVITSFIDSIIYRGKSCIVPAKDIFTTMSVCFAAEKAIKDGKTVKVTYL